MVLNRLPFCRRPLHLWFRASNGQMIRRLHNQISPQRNSTTTAAESQQRATSGVPAADHCRWQPFNNNGNNSLTELDNQLQQVKVFADERIIQFTFESGKSVNYTMLWLRHLCPCSDCNGSIKSFNHQFPVTTNNTNAVNEDSSSSLNVGQIRFNTDTNELEIEWLDNDYRRHNSIYNIKHLNLYYKHI
uniref:Uncharacterized protein LOC113789635 n=1 Tax=Dermatophagoides pteronyssinus TaxID=6956 RepID=A0A6P6XQB5_DERPT|nr:uncharacterized protein LOC113789635 [Dermatophagoides pteronyssinus]